MNKSVVAFAASAGAIDFTAAAIFSAMGENVFALINDEAVVSKNPLHVPFDSRAGLPLPRIAVSPDGTYGQLHELISTNGLAGAVCAVAEAVMHSGSGVIDSCVVQRRLTKILGSLGNLHGLGNARVSLLRAVYESIGLPVTVNTFREFYQGRNTGHGLFGRLDQWLPTTVIPGIYEFSRGGRAKALSAHDSDFATFKQVEVGRGRVEAIHGVNSQGERIVFTRALWEDTLASKTIVRFSGPLEMAYLNANSEMMAHLPWHFCGKSASSGDEPGVVAEVISPPATVCNDRQTMHPGGYLLIDYEGPCGRYGRALMGGEEWPLGCIRYIIARASPVREKMSRSQKKAAHIAQAIVAEEISESPPWPFDEFRTIWRRANTALASLANGSYTPMEAPMADAARLQRIGDNMRQLFESRGIGGIAARSETLKDLHLSMSRQDGTIADRFGRVRFAVRCYSEILTAGLMLICETVLRADLLTLCLLGVSRADLLAIPTSRVEAPVRWWFPVLVTAR